MIRSIRIENFFSFGGEQSIPMSQQSNVLVGINGSGKTNLIRALELLRACAKEDHMPILLTQNWGGDMFNFSQSLKGTFSVTY